MFCKSHFIAGMLAIPLVFIAGISIGILFPGIWPFAAASSTEVDSKPEPARGAGADGKKAESLAQEWAYNPNPGPPNRGNNSFVADRRGFVDQYFRDNGKAKTWFDRAVTFYVEKCGSDFNPITDKKHIIGHHGTNKKGGHYVITEPGLLTRPVSEIPPQPTEILFTYDDSRSSITVLVRQQGKDEVTVMVVAAAR